MVSHLPFFFFSSFFFPTGWLQKWRRWRRTAVTTSCATSGLSASPPSSWPSCSRPCSTCTPCGELRSRRSSTLSSLDFTTAPPPLRHPPPTHAHTRTHPPTPPPPSPALLNHPRPSRCRPKPIDLCFCSTQGFVPDVQEQLPASQAERQKQMVGVPLRDSHFGSHGAILPFVAFQTSPSCSRRSPTFHNFVKLSLTKNPKKRPTAEKLLSVRESIACSSIVLVWGSGGKQCYVYRLETFGVMSRSASVRSAGRLDVAARRRPPGQDEQSRQPPALHRGGRRRPGGNGRASVSEQNVTWPHESATKRLEVKDC